MFGSVLLLALTQTAATIQGQVRVFDSDDPIAYARVGVVELDRWTLADSTGAFRIENIPSGRYEIRAEAPGYDPHSTEIVISDAGRLRVSFTLRLEPFRLPSLTARSARSQAGGAAERALFSREIAPGVVGLSGEELRDVPALAEPDVFRSLHALPGIAPLNDLAARLHVFGGAPDQNIYLWDGVRVFSPNHLFGLVSAFNGDAVGRVNVFRGHLPSRYGGALSSVVEVVSPRAARGQRDTEGGLSLLGIRASVHGQSSDGDTEWLVAGRRTHADVIMSDLFGRDFPYGFFDLQASASHRLSPRDQLRTSGFVSKDRFDMFLEGPTASLDARWRNAAGSVQWTRTRGSSSLMTRAWASHYGSSLRSASGDQSSTAENGLTVGGLSVSYTQSGESVGYRFGLDVEGGRVGVYGTDTSRGYVMGTTRGTYLSSDLHGEMELWLGPLGITPGVRAGYERVRKEAFLEPRLAARIEVFDELTLTAGLSRMHQYLSTLRDDRYVLPGTTFWFVHPDESPVSRSDAISVSADHWLDRAWSLHLTGYARRFEDVPRWRPTGFRTLDQVEYDDGHARGFGAMVRRHEGRVRGWLGYNQSRVRLRDTGTGSQYAAPWDRRHALDAALFLRPNSEMAFSLRVLYGSGTPFWPRSGSVNGNRFDPIQGSIETGDTYPVWADEQRRFPVHFRLDVGVRYNLRVGDIRLLPYASILNATLRRNVLYYRLSLSRPFDGESTPVLRPEHILPAFPSIGVDIRF